MGYDLYIHGVDGDEGYFRANMSGMGLLRGIAGRFGMLNDEQLPSESLHPQSVEEFADHWVSTVPGIPAAKISSNDGWYVAPSEIASALVRYGQLSTAARDAVYTEAAAQLGDAVGDVRSYFEAFIDYLRRAEDAGCYVF